MAKRPHFICVFVPQNTPIANMKMFLKNIMFVGLLNFLLQIFSFLNFIEFLIPSVLSPKKIVTRFDLQRFCKIKLK